MNEDVVWLIAEHIKPDLPTYCKLSAVNRSFYKVFTSDRLWRVFDVYDVTQDIFKSYQKAFEEPASGALLKLVWLDRWGIGQSHSLEKMTCNRFVWLGAMLLSPNSRAFYHKKYKPLAKTALLLRSYVVIDRKYLLNDREFAMRMLHRKPEQLKSFVKFQDDFDVVLTAVSARCEFFNNPCIQYASGRLRADSIIAATAMKTNPRSVGYIDTSIKDKLFHDREWVLKTVAICPDILEFCDWYADDLEVFETALKLNEENTLQLNCRCLQYASTVLREDFELCKLAIEADPENYLACLSQDPRLLYTLFSGKPLNMGYIALSELIADLDPVYNLGTDLELHKMIVERNPEMFERFSVEMQDNEEIAMAACEAFVENFDSVSERLQHDQHFLIKLIGSKSVHKHIWEEFPLEMWKNQEVQRALLAIGASPVLIDEKIGTSLSKDRDVILRYLNALTTSALSSPIIIPDEFRDDDEVMKLAVSVVGCTLRQASARLQDDKEVVTLAFQPNKRAEPGYGKPACMPYKAISPRLRNDKEFIRSLVRMCGVAPIDYMWDEEMALISIKSHSTDYREVPQHLKSDVDFNCLAANANADVAHYLEPQLLLNKRIQESLRARNTFPEYCRVCQTSRLDV